MEVVASGELLCFSPSTFTQSLMLSLTLSSIVPPLPLLDDRVNESMSDCVKVDGEERSSSLKCRTHWTIFSKTTRPEPTNIKYGMTALSITFDCVYL